MGFGPGEYYPSQACEAKSLCAVARPSTMRERAQAAVQQAQARLLDTQRALDILTSNPDLEELLDIMSRNGF